MVRKRKIMVYIAASADRFIARPDDSVDWLDRPQGNYGRGAFYRSIRRNPVGQEDGRHGARLSKERRTRVGLRCRS
jgi:hypothetical protein